VRAKLARLLAPAGTHVAVLLTGSGTSAVEAMVTSAVAPGKKLAVVRNGVYGDRIAEIARRAGIETVEVEAPWTEPPDVSAVARALDDPAVGGLAAVHHETTTGLLNPIREWGALCRARGKPFAVDSVSGMCGDDLDLDGWSIDLVAGTANKCIQGLPGISFVVARRGAIAPGPRRSLYFDLGADLAAQEKGAPRFTMAVQVLYALEAALDELVEETVAGRVARMKRASSQLRAGFARLGLETLLPRELMSATITALALPAGVSYPRLHDLLKARGFVIYAGQGGLEKRAFRVANMGALAEADFGAFLDALEVSLAEARA
jgi:2-aminoethylphosphonate-pyruvate transaminase